MNRCVRTLLTNSQPVQDEKPTKGSKEASSGESQESLNEKYDSTNWVRFYVLVAREIPSYTIDRFYDLTMRQVIMLLDEIKEQKQQDETKQLIMHGIPVKPTLPASTGNQSKSSFSDEDDKKLTEIAERELRTWQKLNPKKT